MDDEAIKQERSLPVSARVDIVSLADLALMFDARDLRINTMSALISSCIDLCHKACMDMGFLDNRHDGISDAMDTLKMAGLIQKSMYERGRKKMNASMGFENLREEGIDPKDYVPGQYNTLHNKRSVDTFGPSKMREIMKTYREIEAKDNEIPVAPPVDEEEQEREFAKLRNPDYNPAVHEANKARYAADQKKIRDTQRNAKLEIARKRALAADECDANSIEEPSETELVDASNKETLEHHAETMSEAFADHDAPRKKTDEENEADAARIKDKDAELIAEMDKMLDG